MVTYQGTCPNSTILVVNQTTLGLTPDLIRMVDPVLSATDHTSWSRLRCDRLDTVSSWDVSRVNAESNLVRLLFHRGYTLDRALPDIRRPVRTNVSAGYGIYSCPEFYCLPSKQWRRKKDCKGTAPATPAITPATPIAAHNLYCTLITTLKIISLEAVLTLINLLP